MKLNRRSTLTILPQPSRGSLVYVLLPVGLGSRLLRRSGTDRPHTNEDRKAEGRIQIRKKLEVRTTPRHLPAFGLRISFGFRVPAFGFTRLTSAIHSSTIFSARAISSFETVSGGVRVRMLPIETLKLNPFSS